jgi:hypothetical protein
MRNRQFILTRRGGELSIADHQLLMYWALACCRHVLSLQTQVLDHRLAYALSVAEGWAEGKVKVGEAMKAAWAAHAAARTLTNAVHIAIARAIGQTVATAHMADHALGAAIYALIATKLAGKSVEAERAWQHEQMHSFPASLRELV